jgi:putative SOS response-associated peptidase YedK
MCGRFSVASDPLVRTFMRLLGEPWPGHPSPNVAPTESAWVIRVRAAADAMAASRAPAAPVRPSVDETAADGAHGAAHGAAPAAAPERPLPAPSLGPGSPHAPPQAAAQPWQACAMRWSLLPHWSRDAKPRHPMINARAETVATHRAFADSFARRRCVVPVTGFFEWVTEDGRRMPQHVTAADGDALLLGGIWDRWRGGHVVVDSFAIVTTDVHANLAFLHDRQPVLLAAADVARWLDHHGPHAALADLMAPRLPQDLLVTPVSSAVNNARNKDPACLRPIGNPRFVARGA